MGKTAPPLGRPSPVLTLALAFQLALLLGRATNRLLRLTPVTLNDPNLDHCKEQPEARHINGNAGKGIARARAKRARAADAAERSGQSTPLAALDEHEKDQEQAQEQQNQVQKKGSQAHGVIL